MNLLVSQALKNQSSKYKTDALIKKNYVPTNHANFVTKDLWKEKYLESTKANNKQCNLCISMVKKVKKEPFQNINLSDMADSKKFWTTASPFMATK